MQSLLSVLRDNSPAVASLAFIVAICFILLKLVQSFFSSKVPKQGYCAEGHDSVVKISHKKKRARKSRPTEISNNQKIRLTPSESERGLEQTEARVKPSTPTLENGGIKQTKKSEKKKSKGKKKRVQTEEAVLNVDDQHSIFDEEGGWRTVNSREQRAKKEKRRQDEIDLTSNLFPVKTSTVPSHPAPHTSMPSTAKDVAPRFAKAAGEEWTEKRASSVSHYTKPAHTPRPVLPQLEPLPSKPATMRTPMTQAVVPEIWQAPKALVQPTLLGLDPSSWTPLSSSSNTNVIFSAQEKSGWSNGTSTTVASTWNATGSSSVTSQRWTGSALKEDWVHVPASSVFQQGLRQWSGIRTGVHANPPDVAQAMIKREEYLLEPEGYVVPPPDVDDPWNPESLAKDEGGDWDSPQAGWANPNEEWKTTPTVAKPQPTYFDESSDEDKPGSSVTPLVSGNLLGASQQAVVGAGPDMLSATSQNANKKQRRRRRKKAVQVTESDVTMKEAEEQTEQLESAKEAVKQVPTDDLSALTEDWSKAGKKKKSRARKDD